MGGMLAPDKLYHFLRNWKITSAQSGILFIITMLLYLCIHPFLFRTTIFPNAITAVSASLSAKLESSGTEEALAILPVIEQILSEAEQILPQVQTRLEETRDIYKAIADEEAKRVAFIEEQGKLKKQLEKIRKSEELQQLGSIIVA